MRYQVTYTIERLTIADAYLFAFAAIDTNGEGKTEGVISVHVEEVD